ncbi:ABC transporter permease subunit [Xylophilus rhododendri]|uniref:ABC transporter permease subunit n=1 Tax=Xylophilus rhododendri TaxID=2697032 RepID=A0A857JBT3_9BURK|nr:ABC transporter permease [Xylophilus rhododendri]QHJ00413.1 ABC transporter permease subunit [Xylophilus rhododendri]
MQLNHSGLRFVLRRLLQALPILIGIAVLNFLLVHLAPGDAATVLAGESGGAPPEYLAQLRAQFGLDQPMYLQLLRYLRNMLTLDLGYSYRHGETVLALILDRMGPTLLLMGLAFVFSICGGVLLGIAAATALNGWRDRLISVLAVVTYATPLFWMGIMLILVFSVKLGWLPTSGMEDVVAFNTGWARVLDIAWHLVLPVLTLSLFNMAVYTRMMRSSMLDQRGQDYVLTARAKGLAEAVITRRHILRNALLPVLTMAGVQVGALLGGSVVIESVFAWPGLGQLAFQSLFARDYNLLLGIFFLSACLVVVVNLVVDLLYSAIDPRMKLG